MMFLIISIQSVSRLCAVMLVVIICFGGPLEICLWNIMLLIQATDYKSQSSIQFIPSSDFFLHVFSAFVLSPPLQLLLVPPPELVHLSSGLRANAAGEGGVVSALHLVSTEQREAQSRWEPEVSSFNWVIIWLQWWQNISVSSNSGFFSWLFLSMKVLKWGKRFSKVKKTQRILSRPHVLDSPKWRHPGNACCNSVHLQAHCVVILKICMITGSTSNG